MIEENRNQLPPLSVDSPIISPDFRAHRMHRIISGITQTSFVWVLSISSLAFKVMQITINIIAFTKSYNITTQTPFRLFILAYTIFTAAHGISFLCRHWGYLFNGEPLEIVHGAEATLFSNILDIFTLFLYFIGLRWLQEYPEGRKEIPFLYYLTKIWVFYGIAVILTPIVTAIFILVLLSYIRPSLPVLEYMPGGKIKEEDAQCTICLTPYIEKDKIRRLPCKHHFHMVCIDEWFGIDDLCPLCKRPVNPLYDIIGAN